jgi:MFS family permease
VGFLFAFAGLAGIFWQGGIIGKLVKKYGEYTLCIAGFIALIVAYVLIVFVPARDWTWMIGITIMNSFGNGVLRPVITSRITQAVGRHEQGVAIGISGSLSSFAMMMAPPTGGFLLDNHWLDAWPLVAAGVAALGFIACLAVGRVASVAAAPTVPKAEIHSEA